MEYGPLTYDQHASWRRREAERMADGTYQALPDCPEFPSFIEDHFPHLSIKGEPDMIAYTPNA
jgi:hypothetical protein